MGEVIFGGVGSGLYGMLLFVLLAVFLAGLMVGRTPEYLGKKIEAREIKLVVLGTIGVPLLVLVVDRARGRDRATATPSIFDAGPQGFTESLYAYTSQANNNGSAFAGYTGYLQPNGTNAGASASRSPTCWAASRCSSAASSRCSSRSPSAARWRASGSRPPGLGTMRTDTPTFVVLLVGAVLLVALLTFVPALLLGPVVQGLTNQLF